MSRPNRRTGDVPLKPLSGPDRQFIDRATKPYRRAALRPLQVPSDTWDWLTVDDVLRIAAASFLYTRQRVQDALRTHRLQDEGTDQFNHPELGPWATRETFADDLSYTFKLRLAKLAAERGLDEQEPLLEMLSAWEGRSQLVQSDAGAEGTPPSPALLPQEQTALAGGG